MRQVEVVRRVVPVILLALAARVVQSQAAPATAAAAKPPAGYAGSGECTTCHKLAAANFAATFKGKLFLEHPRDSKESLGCESCHGPAKQHVQTGGEERGGLIVYGKKNPSPVAVRNENCLSCHQKTARTLWKGSPRGAP